MSFPPGSLPRFFACVCVCGGFFKFCLFVCLLCALLFFLDYSIVKLFILYFITCLCSLLTCKDWISFASVFPECLGIGAQRHIFSQMEFHF